MLINQPTPDIAETATGSPPAVRGDVIGSVAVNCSGQSGATIFTCPSGSYFEGWVFSSGTGIMHLAINATATPYYSNTSYDSGTRNIALYAGDILTNTSSSNWSMVGLLRKA